MRGAVAINEMGDANVASVAKMLETTHGNHIVYLNGFNPATDDVIVIKKDAARAWIEGYTDSEVLHGEQPEWDGSTWYSLRYGYCERVINKSKVVGIANHECVEFVAVKTHRPPVAQEVAEPVADLSDEAKVKAVYPRASHGRVSKCIRSGLDILSDSFPVEAEAWADAARRLEAKRKTVAESTVARLERFTNSLEHLGCGVEVVSGAVLAN